ncbi:MAG: hypothetical protein CTY25_09370 [Methylobacterium sp.]|nr:MAG: hypothetical protein CTY25_09370 [Methylobacterium sp.]
MEKTPTFTLGRRAMLLGATAILAAATAVGTPAEAYDLNSKAAINVDRNGVILRNVDPTTYGPNRTPQNGAADYTATIDGAIYRFASAEARDQFVAAPAKYKPAFGGFCATGAALGKKLDGDPQIFRFHKCQLYVFVHQQAVEIWDKDPAGTLAKANANWRKIRNKTPASL